MTQIGITERGDASIDSTWKSWVYDEQKPAILITKNPKKLIDENRALFVKSGNDALAGNVIMHATITGLGGTFLEPNVPSTEESLSAIEELLSDKNVCKDRIVIRQDPIIPIFGFGNYNENIARISIFAKKHGLRYRTSFFDYYFHTKVRIENRIMNIESVEERKNAEDRFRKINAVYNGKLHLSLDDREKLLGLIYKLSGFSENEIEICGEPEMTCTGCVSQKDLDTFGIDLKKEIELGFQRPACACLGIKKELLNNKHPCAHQCAYCYWKD